MTRLAGNTVLYIVVLSLFSACAQPPPQAHRVISHIVSGGGWRTTITLLNPGATRLTVTLRFKNDRGTPLELSLLLEEDIFFIERTAAEISVSLPPFATSVVQSKGPAESSTAVGWADLTISGSLTDYATFRHTGQDGTVTESSVSIGTVSQPGLIMPFDNSDGYTTGVALVNPNSSFSTINR